MKITKDDFNNFHRDGYIIKKNFFSKKDIKNIFNSLNYLIDLIVSKYLNKEQLKTYTLDQKYLFLNKKSPKLKSRFYDTIKFLDIINEISKSKKFTKISKELLKEKILFNDLAQIRIDQFKDSYWLPQHQELGQISTRLVLFWIPLVDTNHKMGGLSIRPKSHENGFIKYEGCNKEAKEAGPGRQKILNKLFKKKKLSKYKSKFIKLKAGDAVIFHNYLFHGTLKNMNKNKGRWVYISRYNSPKKTPFLNNLDVGLRLPYNFNYN